MNLMISTVLVWEKELEVRHQVEQNRKNGDKPMEIPSTEWFPLTVAGDKNGARSNKLPVVPGPSWIKRVVSRTENSHKKDCEPVSTWPVDVCC